MVNGFEIVQGCSHGPALITQPIAIVGTTMTRSELYDNCEREKDHDWCHVP